jgi:hypothetical protein
VLGINPDAYNRSIVISPHLPGSWNDGAIYDLPVGTNTISFAIKKNGRQTDYSLTSVDANWTYRLKIKGLAGNKYKLNGKVLTAVSDEIELKDKVNKVEVLL